MCSHAKAKSRGHLLGVERWCIISYNENHFVTIKCIVLLEASEQRGAAAMTLWGNQLSEQIGT